MCMCSQLSVIAGSGCHASVYWSGPQQWYQSQWQSFAGHWNTDEERCRSRPVSLHLVLLLLWEMENKLFSVEVRPTALAYSFHPFISRVLQSLWWTESTPRSESTASSSASWSRSSPPSNFVSGHMSTIWLMVCRWPQSQEGDWARQICTTWTLRRAMSTPRTASMEYNTLDV